MIGQIVFNSGQLGANQNVLGQLGMKLAILDSSIFVCISEAQKSRVEVSSCSYHLK